MLPYFYKEVSWKTLKYLSAGYVKTALDYKALEKLCAKFKPDEKIG